MEIQQGWIQQGLEEDNDDPLSSTVGPQAAVEPGSYFWKLPIACLQSLPSLGQLGE